VIQPLLTVERTVERAPGRWPLSPAAEGGGRQARLYKGQASLATIATGGPMGSSSEHALAPSPLPRATSPIRNSKEPKGTVVATLENPSTRGGPSVKPLLKPGHTVHEVEADENYKSDIEALYKHHSKHR
jgi:hypothetical protein